MERTLSAVQVAVMLISASYGIGFLFGSGEMALTHGMGGSMYGVATAFGMLLLALFARSLWRTGEPIWTLFGNAYGRQVKNAVALLSVLWMAGVLAAQIHGGVAIAQLLGFNGAWAYASIIGCIFAASRLNLRLASLVFSFFLLVSGLVLIWVLLAGNGKTLYLNGPARFLADLDTFKPGEALSIAVAVVMLVCTGADYHQFVLAARRSKAAVAGCLLAALCLFAISFVPASVVLGLKEAGALEHLGNAKQVIPFALGRQVEAIAPSLAIVLLIGLCSAALGSGAAVLRAMTDALHAASDRSSTNSPALAVIALAMAGALAAQGQSIIATMVSVNIVYIGSIATLFGAMLFGHRILAWQAKTVIGAGFSAASCIYLGAAVVAVADSVDTLALGAGVLTSTALFASFFLINGTRRQAVGDV